MGIPILERIYRFVDVTKPRIDLIVQRRTQDLTRAGLVYPTGIQNCRHIIFGVSDEHLAHHHMRRIGADIQITPANDTTSHAYFSPLNDDEHIVDFAPVFLARCLNTPLKTVRTKHPHLFYRGALVASKKHIERALDLQYPKQNVPFWEYFFGKK